MQPLRSLRNRRVVDRLDVDAVPLQQQVGGRLAQLGITDEDGHDVRRIGHHRQAGRGQGMLGQHRLALVALAQVVAALQDAHHPVRLVKLAPRMAFALDLHEDERLLIVGVGTGMELEYLPGWVRGGGVDLSAGMLQRARQRRAKLGMRGLDLQVMDARRLDFPDGSFEAVYLPLILTVVEAQTAVICVRPVLMKLRSFCHCSFAILICDRLMGPVDLRLPRSTN